MLLEEAAKEQKRFPNTTTDETTPAPPTSDNNGLGQYTKMCGLIKTMFEKISTLLFDQETVSKLLKFIFEKVSNGNGKKKTNHCKVHHCDHRFLEPEQPAAYYENLNQLLKVNFDRSIDDDDENLSFHLKVFIQHPFIFNSSESLELLCNLLKQRVLELAPILIRTIEACAPLIIVADQSSMLT